MREQIIGIRVIRAFVREPFESERYDDANVALTEVSVKVGNIFVLMFPIIMLILNARHGRRALVRRPPRRRGRDPDRRR